ncbi:MAG TPA: hypothetical protein VGH91_08780 [Gammaproteobacteria bacterium]|jgi:hypothetical protein
MMPLAGSYLAWNPALTLGLDVPLLLGPQAVKAAETANNAARLRNFIGFYSPKMPG